MENNENKIDNFESQQLNYFILLAKENTSESWAKIDSKMPEFCNNEVFLKWAKDNILIENNELRDLAASIIESTDAVIDNQVIQDLYSLMKVNESYPGFRAACALAKRLNNENVKPLVEEIKEKLDKFKGDEDVSSIAIKYLKSFEQ